MPAPLIGITTSRMDHSQGHSMVVLAEAYVQSIIDAGGAPFLIPLGLPEEMLKDILKKVDGILFTGGGDIHPEMYGGQTHPSVSLVDEDRDRIELHLFQDTVQARKPLFGICRGLQIMNVASGGSLFTHILDQHPGALQHSYYPDWPRTYIAHEVTITENSRLAQAIGQTDVQVNSLHHQGICQLAPGLVATAFAPDGLVEGVEIPDYPFGLGVQWHPEWLQNQPAMRALFRAFVEAARMKHSAENAMHIE
jgi:putative glutamine amidotransferase